MDTDAVERVRRKFCEARCLVVSTGAGVSAECGIPTFRGRDGLWRKRDPTDLATAGAFARDPDLVWEWYDWRRGLVLQTEPGPSHRALAAMEQRAKANNRRFTLITQNVDGLHRRAGSMDPIEVHGSLFDIICSDPTCAYRERREDHPLPQPMSCPRCSARLRPGVVWFGEALDRAVLQRATTALADCDAFMVAGSSSVVYPAAGFLDLARRSGAFTVECNLEPTPVSSAVDVSLVGKSADILPRLVS